MSQSLKITIDVTGTGYEAHFVFGDAEVRVKAAFQGQGIYVSTAKEFDELPDVVASVIDSVAMSDLCEALGANAVQMIKSNAEDDSPIHPARDFVG